MSDMIKVLFEDCKSQPDSILSGKTRCVLFEKDSDENDHWSIFEMIETNDEKIMRDAVWAALSRRQFFDKPIKKIKKT